MDMGSVTQIVGTLGFPIAVCLLCFWYIVKQNEQHRAEIAELSKAVNNNTLALAKIAEHFEGMEVNITE